MAERDKIAATCDPKRQHLGEVKISKPCAPKALLYGECIARGIRVNIDRKADEMIVLILAWHRERKDPENTTGYIPRMAASDGNAKIKWRAAVSTSPTPSSPSPKSPSPIATASPIKCKSPSPSPAMSPAQKSSVNYRAALHGAIG